MQRRRIVAAVAMVAAAGAAVALTLPAVAGTDSAEDRARNLQAPAGPADLLAAMERDLGLTGDQARERIRKDGWATDVSADLRAETGASFGGAWVNAQTGKLTVAVTDKSLTDEVRAAGAEPKVVARSEHQLDAAKQQLDAEALRRTRDIPGWFVDAASNTVTVLARPGADKTVEKFVEAAGVPAAAVKVVETQEQPTLFFDVRGGDPFFVGRFRCSVGFSVVGGFVTAGHCGQQGATTAGFNRTAQGTFSVSSFPGDDFGVVQVNGDWTPQPVVANSNGADLPVAGSDEAPVGAAVCRSGSTTGTRCGVIQAKNVTVNYPEGRVTGLTRTNVCAEGGDSGGAWLSGDQAQGITSGGSGNCTIGGTTFFQPINEVLATQNLTLVTAAAAEPEPPAPPTADPTAPPTAEPTGEPTEPPVTEPPATEPPVTEPPATEPPATEPPVTEPPATEPPATEPPATVPPTTPPPGDGAPPAVDACKDSSVFRDGRLKRSRAVQLQPRGGFFRAQAGLHTACLDGPGRADFDLFLLQWSPKGWKVVARSTGPDGDEELTFNGPAGSYRYLVRSHRGSGGYTLGFSAP